MIAQFVQQHGRSVHHVLLYESEVVQVAHVHDEVSAEMVSDQTLSVLLHERLTCARHLAISNETASKTFVTIRHGRKLDEG